MSAVIRTGFDNIVNELTHFSTELVKSKYYTIKNLKDYLLEQSEGAWQDHLATQKIIDFDVDGEEFFGNGGSPTGSAEVSFDRQILLSQRQIGRAVVNIDSIDIMQMQATHNFSVQQQKIEGLKRRYDLYKQELIMKGKRGMAGLYTLENKYNILVDTTTLPTEAAFIAQDGASFVQTISNMLNIVYQASYFTDLPTRLVFPAGVYNALALELINTANGSNITKLAYIEQAFKSLLAGYGKAEDFKVLANAYPDNTPALKGQVLMYNGDGDTIAFDNPLNFQQEVCPDRANFNIQVKSYFQIGEVVLKREREFVKFVFTV